MIARNSNTEAGLHQYPHGRLFKLPENLHVGRPHIGVVGFSPKRGALQFSCSEADRVEVERIVGKTVTAKELRKAVQAAMDIAASWSSNAASALKRSRPKGNVSTASKKLFRDTFGTSPEFVPSWRPAGKTWNRGDVVRARLKHTARKLKRRSIKVFCWGPNQRSDWIPNLAVGFNRENNTMYLGPLFWNDWKSHGNVITAIDLLQATFLISYRTINDSGKKGGYGNSNCYVAFVLKFNRISLPELVRKRCGWISRSSQQEAEAETDIPASAGNKPLGTEPLQNRLEPALKQAVSRFKRLVYNRRKLKLKYRYGWRTVRPLLCYLIKVLEPGVDDRYIPSSKICTHIGHNPEGGFGPAGETLTGCTAASEKKLRFIKTKNDVDNSTLFEYLKPLLVDLHQSFPSRKQDKFVLEQLIRIGFRVRSGSRLVNFIYAKFEKASVVPVPPGITPGAMPYAYGIILDWIHDRYKDKKSIYSCL